MLIKDKDIASYQLKSKKEEIEEMEKMFSQTTKQSCAAQDRILVNLSTFFFD